MTKQQAQQIILLLYLILLVIGASAIAIASRIEKLDRTLGYMHDQLHGISVHTEESHDVLKGALQEYMLRENRKESVGRR